MKSGDRRASSSDQVFADVQDAQLRNISKCREVQQLQMTSVTASVFTKNDSTNTFTAKWLKQHKLPHRNHRHESSITPKNEEKRSESVWLSDWISLTPDFNLQHISRLPQSVCVHSTLCVCACVHVCYLCGCPSRRFLWWRSSCRYLQPSMSSSPPDVSPAREKKLKQSWQKHSDLLPKKNNRTVKVSVLITH